MTLAVVLSFLALLLLCTLALLWSRWPGWLKGLLVAGVAVFYFWADDVAHNLSGWPAADPLPERFVLLAAVIDEPNTKSAGALYIWVNGIEGGKPMAQPRAYRLPYAKDLHTLAQRGDEEIAPGRQPARHGHAQGGQARLRLAAPGQ